MSSVTAVNFTITQEQLEEKLISTIVVYEHPYMQEELNDLHKINIRDCE
jgi:hypothetical protein